MVTSESFQGPDPVEVSRLPDTPHGDPLVSLTNIVPGKLANKCSDSVLLYSSRMYMSHRFFTGYCDNVISKVSLKMLHLDSNPNSKFKLTTLNTFVVLSSIHFSFIRVLEVSSFYISQSLRRSKGDNVLFIATTNLIREGRVTPNGG